MTNEPLRIATRSSRLALWQANHVAAALRALPAAPQVELVEVSTTGDQDRSQPLHEFGGVGVFTREVQRAVLDRRADIAVHSLKDLPTETVDGLTLAAVPERASQYDALVLPADSTQEFSNDLSDALLELPYELRIGTGSLRRQAQLLHVRNDFQIENIRGNVETRLQKLDEGEFDALILAEAGLNRLDLGHRISRRMTPPVLFPAVGQGALGIECRADDDRCRDLLAAIEHSPSRCCVDAERSLLADLQAGCHAPVGVLAEISGDALTLETVVLSPDGATRLQAKTTGASNSAVELGREVAGKLRARGANELI